MAVPVPVQADGGNAARSIRPVYERPGAGKLEAEGKRCHPASPGRLFYPVRVWTKVVHGAGDPAGVPGVRCDGVALAAGRQNETDRPACQMAEQVPAVLV